MVRLSLLDEQSDPALATLAQRIRDQRGGKLLELYQVLLHSPKVAEAWLGFFTVLRQQCELDARWRELAILHVAVLNDARYEFEQHVPFALAAGVTQGQIDSLADWRSADCHGVVERAVLGYTEAMTRSIRVSDEVFAEVRRYFPSAQIVELTATIGGYNLVSRFLEALRIGHG